MSNTTQQSQDSVEGGGTIYEDALYEACKNGAKNASSALSKLAHTQVRVMLLDNRSSKGVITYREQVKAFVEKCINAYRRKTIILQSNVVEYPLKKIVGIFTMFIEQNDYQKVGEMITQRTIQTQANKDIAQSAVIEMANIIANSYMISVTERINVNYLAQDSKIIDFESFDIFLSSMLTGGSLEMKYIFFENVLVIGKYAVKIPLLVGFSENFLNSNKL